MHISYRDHGPHNLPANTRQVTASCDPRLLAPGWSRDRIAAAAACRISSDSKCWNDVEINHFLVCTTSLAGAEAPLHINIFCKHVVLIFQHSGLRVKQLLIFQSINFRTIKLTAGSRAVTAQNNKTNLCFASSRCPLSCLIPPDPMYYANFNAWISVEKCKMVVLNFTGPICFVSNEQWMDISSAEVRLPIITSLFHPTIYLKFILKVVQSLNVFTRVEN